MKMKSNNNKSLLWLKEGFAYGTYIFYHGVIMMEIQHLEIIVTVILRMSRNEHYF
jgi:hypothetical protein